MEHKTYVVLVRTDEQNRIIKINSSAFVADAEGWVRYSGIRRMVWARVY